MSVGPLVEATHCHVCGEVLEQHTAASCNICGNAFHLNQRQDMEGKDCGEVWINEEHLALEFGCFSCLRPAETPADLDEVLDLAEAAREAGISESQMEEAAAGGRVAHRRTAGDVLLFRRRDIVAFRDAQP